MDIRYQEQKIIVASLLFGMIAVVIAYVAYLSYIAVGVFIISEDIKEEPRTVVVRVTEKVPVFIKETPKVEQPTPVVASAEVEPKQKVEPPKEKPVNKDLKLLAKIINAEAGNQPYKGKVAVGNVIMNRVDHPKFPDTIKDVVYQKGQFSPVSNGSIHKEPNKESIQAAKEVLNGHRVVDDNVLYFYNPDISTSGWIFTREVVNRIGDHAFAL